MNPNYDNLISFFYACLLCGRENFSFVSRGKSVKFIVKFKDERDNLRTKQDSPH